MSVVSIRRSRRAALAVSAVLLLSACSSSATPSPAAPTQAPATSGASVAPPPSAAQAGGSVTVWTAWGGQELKAFQDVLKPFSTKTGIEVKLSTVRDASQIAINVTAGTTLPDIALPPTPDNVIDWANKGVMKPLDTVLDWNDYSTNTFPALTTCPASDCVGIYVVGGKHYAAFVKTQVKGLIWYDPKVFTGTAPKTWDELNAIQPPAGSQLWCAAFESGAASGWPGTDDIGNIVLRSTDPQHYMDWYNGKLKWTDPIIKGAYQKFGQMVAADKLYGGTNTALTTFFGKAGIPLFKNPPGCLFVEQATFITNFFIDPKNGGDANLKAGTDFSFFAHPSIDPQYDGNIMGFADSLVMYNDTPQAQALMKYLVSVDAENIWAGGGGTLAARKDVTNYTDPISKEAVKIVAGAKNILLTPGDQMPADMQKAFWQSVLDYTKDPSKLDSILAHLDEVQSSAYAK